MPNLVGNEAGRAIYDGDAMIASCGKMVAMGPRFSYGDVNVTSAQVDLDAVRVGRARTASYRPDVDDDANCVSFDFKFKFEEQLDDISTPKVDWESSTRLKEEEFTRAVSLALFDYLRKSRSRGFVVSLSGGADSAAVATLCSFMVQLAVQDLEEAELKRKLAYIESLAFASKQAMVRGLLTCVYQATRNSSDTTRNAAQGLAEAIGAQFFDLDIDPLVTGYVDLVSDAIQRELSWDKDDLALQNIQARTRGPSVWLFANLFGRTVAGNQ